MNREGKGLLPLVATEDGLVDESGVLSSKALLLLTFGCQRSVNFLEYSRYEGVGLRDHNSISSLPISAQKGITR